MNSLWIGLRPTVGLGPQGNALRKKWKQSENNTKIIMNLPSCVPCEPWFCLQPSLGPIYFLCWPFNVICLNKSSKKVDRLTAISVRARLEVHFRCLWPYFVAPTCSNKPSRVAPAVHPLPTQAKSNSRQHWVHHHKSQLFFLSLDPI